MGHDVPKPNIYTRSATIIEDWEKRRRGKVLKIKIPHVSKAPLFDGQWNGQPCFIIGGGPSMEALLPRLVELADFWRIGVNASWMDEPCPQIVYAKDYRFLDVAERRYGDRWPKGHETLDREGLHYGEKWRELADRQVRVTDRVNASRRKWTATYWIDQIDLDSWGRTLKAVSHCEAGLMSAGNSGLSALNLADILGADPIFLLGFDCQQVGHRFNYHDRYPKGWQPRGPWMEKNLTHYKMAAPKIRAKVYNVCPQSFIEDFEKITFDEALEEARACIKEQDWVAQSSEPPA